MEENYEACCPDWFSYDDAMCLEENDIKLQCNVRNTSEKMKKATKTNSDLNVESAVSQVKDYIKEGESKLTKDNLHDAIIFFKLAFHMTKVIFEVNLPFSHGTHLLSAQYTLFRVILMHKYRLEERNKAELSKFDLLPETKSREIIMPPPPPPGKPQTTEAEALIAVQKIQLSRPRLPLEAVVGQHVAIAALRDRLITPYEQAKAFHKTISTNGILMYGPPGNGKE